jgi:hypothetical protein
MHASQWATVLPLYSFCTATILPPSHPNPAPLPCRSLAPACCQLAAGGGVRWRQHAAGLGWRRASRWGRRALCRAGWCCCRDGGWKQRWAGKQSGRRLGQVPLQQVAPAVFITVSTRHPPRSHFPTTYTPAAPCCVKVVVLDNAFVGDVGGQGQVSRSNVLTEVLHILGAACRAGGKQGRWAGGSVLQT